VAAAACTHLGTVEVLELPEPPLGCEECLKTGDRWLHLRMCLACGKVGCCDSSPNKHATAHYHETGHPLVRSAEPGEDWSWCYVDEVALVLRPD
jgi:uncharacterized UBP type Zn finger protein